MSSEATCKSKRFGDGERLRKRDRGFKGKSEQSRIPGLPVPEGRSYRDRVLTPRPVRVAMTEHLLQWVVREVAYAH